MPTSLRLHTQVFPYLYVPYYPDLPRAPQEVSSFLRRFGSRLEAALRQRGQDPSRQSNLAEPNGTAVHSPPQADRPRQHVYHVLLVTGTPFYGYHQED